MLGTALAVLSWSALQAGPIPRGEWSGPAVTVTQADGKWVVAGEKTKVTIKEADLAVDVQAGPARWSLLPSAPQDMLVRWKGKDLPLRLADARKVAFARYDTGFRTGVKVTLGGWRSGPGPKAAELDLTVFLTLGLEGKDEELVFEVAAEEKNAVLRRLDWPATLDARDVDHTVLSNYRGVLLPRAWPKVYSPIRNLASHPDEGTEVQSNVIESWSMSWWGFQKGPSALLVIVETPDDAAYQFDHPAGGPTVIGPRWRPSLGRFAYPRRARLCFFAEGNYVDLAKRYRRHALETGLFVSLKEKIASRPRVKDLIGTPLTRLSILRNLKPDSARFDAAAPEKNYALTTYDERVRQLREVKAKGLERFHVVLTGWPYLGYDRQHPDGWPPSPEAGGWGGLKRLADVCRELGYLFSLHDQYRDYYVDAPSYDPQFAVHEEDAAAPPQAFPGTRFGSWKEGRIPFMKYWDGGKQALLNSRFMLGHLRKNYELLFDHGIRPDGSYLDVFGYVPPDEDFNPEHPTTRTEAIRDRVTCYGWTRRNLGLVGTEAAVDWVVPYVDYSSPLGPGRGGIPVPLFNLVYHDAIITPYNPTDLHGFLNGGLPQVRLADLGKDMDRVRRMAALHERVALLEMTKHEFLDPGRRKERTTFADGTTVTVDWDAQTFTVSP